MRIGILGAGHAGLTLFACLDQSGVGRPKLYSHVDHSQLLSHLLSKQGQLQLHNTFGDDVHVVHLTSDDLAVSIADLVESSDLIFNTTPVNAHDEIFEEVLSAPRWHVRPLTYVNLGGGFSVFGHIARARGVRRAICLGTFHTLPFASRVVGSRATLLNVRKHTSFAFHGSKSVECMALLREVFSTKFEEDNNILHMSLDRSSYVMHPLLTIFNANRIDKKEDFFFYADGFSDSIKALLLQAGYERQELAGILGFHDYPDPVQRLANFERNYGEDFKTIRPPSSLQHRYIHEDIPFGLVPICGLGEAFGLNMPVSRSLVDIASAVTGLDLWDSPYNLSQNPVLLAAFLEGQRVTLQRKPNAARPKIYEVAA